jgi:hypothetical protein
MTQSTTLIEERVLRMTRRAQATLRFRIGLCLVLLVAMTAYGYWIHSKIKTFGAEDAALLARTHIAGTLPAARARLTEQLRGAAPQMVGRVLDQAVQSPALLRGWLEENLRHELERRANELSGTLRRELAADAARARTVLNDQFPGMNDRERMDRISNAFLQAYAQRLRRVREAVTDPYHASLEEVRVKVDHLRRGQNLSDRERLEREILVTFLEIHTRARERGEVQAFPDTLMALPFLRQGG